MDLKGKWKDGLPSIEALERHDNLHRRNRHDGALWLIQDDRIFYEPAIIQFYINSGEAPGNEKKKGRLEIIIPGNIPLEDFPEIAWLKNPKHWPLDKNGDRVEYNY